MEEMDLDAFDSLRIEGIRKTLINKENGVKVVGSYCTYFPRELIIAAGAIPFGLCGTREVTAKIDLPQNLCPLIKSSYGQAITDQCPYFSLADLVIGETTCDGKKKMFEILRSKGIKDVYVMHLPQMPEGNASLYLLYEELQKLKHYLETSFKIVITDEMLREAIHITNEEKHSMQKLFDLNKATPPLISGMDILHITSQVKFTADCKESIRNIQDLTANIKARALSGYTAGNISAKRILLTGTPVGIGSEKVVRIVEEGGGIVVAMENCGGYKTIGLRIDEDDSTDPLLLMAQKYLKIPCSVMSPNNLRIELLKEMVRDFTIDGVIDLTWQACLTYSIESHFVSNIITKELDLPYLQIETDYSQSDIENLRVRIEAFLEMIPNR